MISDAHADGYLAGLWQAKKWVVEAITDAEQDGYPTNYLEIVYSQLEAELEREG